MVFDRGKGKVGGNGAVWWHNDSEYFYRSEDLFQSGLTFDRKALSYNLLLLLAKGYAGIFI